MKIGIDVSVLEKGVTGIGRYLINILQNIPKIDKENRYFLFSHRKPFRDSNFYTPIATGSHFSPKIFSPFWLNYVLPRHLAKYRIDLLFSPNHLAPIKTQNTKWKNIIAVHDIGHKIEKRFKPLSYRNYLDLLLRISVQQCNKIVTVSEFSKKEIMRIFNLSTQKIYVIYNFANEIFKPRIIDKKMRDSLRKTYGIPDEYILYVGVIENRKNILGILKISAIIKAKGYDIKTLLIGKPGHGFNKIYEEIKKNSNVLYLNHLDDEVLPFIYNMAKVFLFPSFYEGFGLPPLEAMQSGIPVLSSNTSSLPEVIGDGGIMHNPDDYESFANDIIRLIEDKDFYQIMSKKALKQASKFNAFESINALVKVFNECN